MVSKDIEIKNEEVQLYSEGLKDMVQLVNKNKHLILEDILKYVDLFDSATNKTKNILFILSKTLEVLFKKVSDISDKENVP